MLASKNSRIAVIGGGSWATALIKILSEKTDSEIFWWIRKKDQVDHIQKYRRNPSYLSDVQIDTKKVFASSDLTEVLKKSEIIVLATPAAYLASVLESVVPEYFKNKIFVSAIKGMIPEQNLLISQYLQNTFAVNPDSICMISGPCHSEEVAMEKQSYLTIAGLSQSVAQTVADLLNCRFIKTTVNTDLYGVEFAAVMKNVYGIACGLSRGLNYGDNFQAVLVSNAMQEMGVFLNHFNKMERGINASAYLGDLLVTAYSQFSRNRTLGNMVGRGYSVKSALVEMNMVAEGFFAVKSLHELTIEKNVELPIIKAVYNILYEKISPSIEFKILETRLS